MSKLVPRVCPTIINIRMKGLVAALEQRDQKRVDRLCTLFVQHMETANVVVFTRQEVDHVCEQISYIHILTFMDLYDMAISIACDLRDSYHSIGQKRTGVIYALRAIWHVPHLAEEFSMGAIDDLPSLVKYEISKHLEKEYNMP